MRCLQGRGMPFNCSRYWSGVSSISSWASGLPAISERGQTDFYLGHIFQELIDGLEVDPRQCRLQLTQTFRVHRIGNPPEIDFYDFQSREVGISVICGR